MSTTSAFKEIPKSKKFNILLSSDNCKSVVSNFPIWKENEFNSESAHYRHNKVNTIIRHKRICKVLVLKKALLLLLIVVSKLLDFVQVDFAIVLALSTSCCRPQKFLFWPWWKNTFPILWCDVLFIFVFLNVKLISRYSKSK